MNCKPGDLAIMVASDYPENRDKLCIVMKSGETFEGGQWYWLCRFPRAVMWWDHKRQADVMSRNGHVADADLRPIRDPGDDAVDEMLHPLPNTLEVA